MFTKIDKFLVAAIGTAVTLGLLTGTAQDVAGAITAALTYLVPNAE